MYDQDNGNFGIYVVPKAGLPVWKQLPILLEWSWEPEVRRKLEQQEAAESADEDSQRADPVSIKETY